MRCTATTSARSGSRRSTAFPRCSGRRSRIASSPERTVLVTGASSGIGAACAARLARAGWHVYAGVRNPGDAPADATEVLLDVTDPAAVESLRFERLDGLVNNAGIAVAAPFEDLPLAELRRQLEVNVVGQLAVTKAVLPAVRAARGRIVLVGSIAGRSALPFLGAYAISKFALEAMADSFRVEVAPDGIEVALIEPGTIATAIWTKPQPLADVVSERYRARVEAFRRVAAARAAKAVPAEEVARAVEHALTAARPKTRYVVGRDARLRARLEQLPDRLRDRVLAALLRG
ncbi:MAG TPA: SDR family oxidoreductase [Gaiellaceae bacterium]|nr:SDR family oxidoreductase [Gaiellaceae bacterium]